MPNVSTTVTFTSAPSGSVLVAAGTNTTVSFGLGPLDQAAVATQVAAQMGGYAPLTSPALTGAPTSNGVPLATTDDAFLNALIYGS